MILNTGQRTDIPAFYADWFLRRVREGSVMVRNPFNYQRITSYRIDPEVVDVIAFCTKNPAPMLGKLGELAGYRQYWHVTITPYDRDIEPNVPPAGEVISSCLEDPGLAKIGIDTSGCMTKEKLEKAFNLKLKIPNIKTHQARQGCACLLGNDIGAYTTCPHLCKYCYANESPEAVIENRNKHDPHSPLLIGHVEKEDQVVEARQESWIDREISLF